MLASRGEWTDHHLVQEDTECPPFHSLRVPLAFQQLRCNVFWCSAECYLGVRIAVLHTTDDDVLFVFSVSDMLSLHRPKSHSAM